MAYFTTTPTGFDAALKEFSSNREYRVRLNVDDTPVDITTSLDNNNVTIQHREGSGAQADIRLRNADGTFEEGAYANATIGIDARVDSSDWIPVFYGWVDDKGIKREVGVGHNSQARIQAHTIEKRHGTRQRPTPIVMSEWKICDPDNTGTSIVHKLAELMGVATADLDVGKIDYVRDWLEIGKRSPWRELQDLAALYRATMYTRADGKLRLRSQVFETTPPSLSAEWSFANDDSTFTPNIRDARQVVQGEYVPVRCNRGTCEFDDYEALGTGRVIWLSTQNYDEITRRIAITLAPGEYWPSAANANAVAKLQYKDPITGTEIPFALDVITPTIGTPGSGSDIESNNGLPTIISFNGSTAATTQSASHSEIILRNNTAGTIVLYKFQLRGTGFRVRANYTVKYQDPAITDEEDFVDASLPGTYAAGEAQVHTALQNLVHDGKGGRRKWSFVTHWLPQVQIAALVNFRLPGEDYTTCKVTGYTHPAPSGPMVKAETRLEIEEITTFTPAGTPDPVIDFSGDPSPGPNYSEFDEAVDDRPTYEEVVDGFNAGGGTVTPTVPTPVAMSAGNRAIVIEWDSQANLTAKQTFEVQVSINESNWYSLDQTGTGLGTLNAETPVAGTMIVHGRLPLDGDDDDPVASQWFYRVRRLAGSTPSAWSSAVSAFSLALAQGDLAANSIYGNNIRAGEVEASKMAADNFLFTKSVGSQSRETPQSGDVRSYLGKDPIGAQGVADPVEIAIEEYNGETWESRFKAGMRSGGGVADAFVSGFFEAGESVLSSPGLIWTERKTFGAAGAIRNVRYGNGVFIAIGSQGIVERSIDNGITWDEPTTLPALTTFYINRGLDYDGSGVWVFGSTHGGISRSIDDGENWSAFISNPFDALSGSAAEIFTIIYGDYDTGVWIAGGTEGRLSRSTDGGLNWSPFITTPMTGTIFHGAFFDNAFFIVGENGEMSKSTDGGENWSTLITTPFGTTDIMNIEKADGVVIIVGYDGKIARSLDDGTTWGSLISNPFGTSDLLGTVWGDGVWIAFGQDGKISRSTDNGETWGTKTYGDNNISQPFGSDGWFRAGYYGGNRFIVVGFLSSTNDGFIATSDWLEAGSGIVEQGSNANGEYVVFSSGLQICVGAFTESLAIDVAWGNIYISPDRVWAFPKPFAGSPWGLSGSVASGGTVGWIITGSISATQAVFFACRGPIRTTTDTWAFRPIAIGMAG